MVSLNLARNDFEGEIPEALYEAPLVTYLDISGNRCARRRCAFSCFRVWRALLALHWRAAPGILLPCFGRGRVSPPAAPPLSPPPPSANSNKTATTQRHTPPSPSLPSIKPRQPNANNSLTGPITTGISLLIYLTDFDASRNQLDGEVKTGIFFLPQLARLNLAHNRFTGRLESDLG